MIKITIPLRFETLCLGLKPDIVKGPDNKYLHKISTSEQKSYHKEWLIKNPPTIEDWIKVVQDIFKMEKLTFILRQEDDTFQRHWENWIRFTANISTWHWGMCKNKRRGGRWRPWFRSPLEEFSQLLFICSNHFISFFQEELCRCAWHYFHFNLQQL